MASACGVHVVKFRALRRSQTPVGAGSVSHAACATAAPAAAHAKQLTAWEAASFAHAAHDRDGEEMREASKDSSRFSVCKMRKADAARGPEGMCESAAGAPRDKIGPKTPPEELYPPSPAKRLGGKSDRSLPAGSGAQAGGSSMCAVAGGDRGAPRKTHSIMV
jgi:hypothetical protein